MLDGEWLLDEVVASPIEDAGRLAVETVAAREEDADGGIDRPEAVEDLTAVEIREDEVEDDEIDLVLAAGEDVDGRRTAG